ncbi:MAG: ABC transporter substrate-binding protein [Armatimonadota bacterium]|nr:ABC transporter substrate-binding protein [Armatimonadota bacterium]MDR7534046.1 ABC transporter substrate-binding protein [Armatimonadota bacterium]MDR7534959.1 ABC transporter substrate-binding protein [Armatimonadota bacterium]
MSKLTRREFVKRSAMLGGAAALTTVPQWAIRAAEAATPAEVKIGHLHPLSGGLALEGGEMRDAILLAADDVNRAGGIRSLGGARVTVVHGNTEGSPDKGAAEAERLIGEGVVGLLGAYQSAVAFVTTQVAERRRIPYVITVAVADEILERGFTYSFRVQPNSTAMAQYAVEYLTTLGKMTRTPVHTITIMHESSIFGVSIGDRLVRFAGPAGLRILERIVYPTATADVTTECTKVRAANPDVAIFTGYFRDGVLVARTIREVGLRAKAIMGVANGAFSHPRFSGEAGPLASENVMDANYYYNPVNPRTRGVFRAYRERFNRDMSTHAVYAYAATRVLLDAIERAGAVDPTKIRAALAETNMRDHILPQAEIKFDSKGENVNARPVLLQVRGGTPRVILPERYGEMTPVFPAM